MVPPAVAQKAWVSACADSAVGQVQPIAYSAWHHMSEEAWAVITGELVGGNEHGVSLKALQADLKRLKG